jgi:hypothetical protein
MLGIFRKCKKQETVTAPEETFVPEKKEIVFWETDTPKQRSEKIWESLGYWNMSTARTIQLAEYLEMYMLWDKGLPEKPDSECYFVYTVEETATDDKEDESCSGGARQVSKEDGTDKKDSLQE